MEPGAQRMPTPAAAAAAAAGTALHDLLRSAPVPILQLMWAVAKLSHDTARAAAAYEARAARSEGANTNQPDHAGSAQLQLRSGIGLAGDRPARLLHVLADVAAHHVAEGRVPSPYVAQGLWAWVRGARGANHPFVTAAVTCLSQHILQLPPSELVMALTALTDITTCVPTPTSPEQHQPRAAQRPDPSQTQAQSTTSPAQDKAVSQAAARCWAVLGDHANDVLPHLSAPHLAALCEAAARHGVRDRRVYGLATQLVLQAAAGRAQQLLTRATQQGEQNSGWEDGEEDGNGAGSSMSGSRPQGADQPQVGHDELEGGQQGQQTGATGAKRMPADSSTSSRFWRTHALAALAASAPMRVAWGQHHEPDPNVLASLLGSLTAVGLRSRSLFAAAILVAGTPGGAARLSPSHLHRLLCACTAARVYNVQLYSCLAARTQQYIHSLSAVQQVDVLCALAAARHYDAGVVEAVCAAVQAPRALYSLGPEHVSRLVWAIGFLGAGVFVEVRG